MRFMVKSRILKTTAVVLMALGMGTTMSAAGAQAAVTPTTASVKTLQAATPNTFPIVKDVSPTIVKPGNPWYEGATATLSNNGRLDVTQRVYSKNWFSGFHAGTTVFLTDAAGNILYISQKHVIGVDGMYTGWPSDKTENWTEMIPQSVLDTPGLQMRVVLSYDPKNMLLWDLQQAGTILAAVAAAAAAAGAIVALF